MFNQQNTKSITHFGSQLLNVLQLEIKDAVFALHELQFLFEMSQHLYRARDLLSKFEQLLQNTKYVSEYEIMEHKLNSNRLLLKYVLCDVKLVSCRKRDR